MVKILITGDFCMHDRMLHFRSNEIVAAMESVVSYIRGADYAITNLECSVFDGEYKPITKCGINLHNSSESVKALKKIGFKGVTLANNHFADFGHEAVIESINLLKQYRLDYFGAGRNLQEASPVKYIEIKNKKIAIINCCEHEYTIATDTTGGANPLDVVDINHSILEAKEHADYVIVVIHGGSEHYPLPTPRMQKWYRFFIDSGADLVVNHHQHCYSGYEVYKGKPIVYGLGNFCFDWEGQRNSDWNSGYMLQVLLDQGIRIELIPYEQCNDNVGTYVLRDREEFDRRLDVLNEAIQDEMAIKKLYDDFIQSKHEEYIYVFNNSQNRFLRRLAKKGLLPSELASEILPPTILENNERLLTLLSYFQCESHHDVMTEILKEHKSKL